MTKHEFLKQTNGRARRRLLSSFDYHNHCLDVEVARAAASRGEPFYMEHNAGGVANSYGSTTTTARCGVYVDPETKKVVEIADRVSIHGRSVPCVYHGGERSYYGAFYEARRQEVIKS